MRGDSSDRWWRSGWRHPTGKGHGLSSTREACGAPGGGSWAGCLRSLGRDRPGRGRGSVDHENLQGSELPLSPRQDFQAPDAHVR